MKALPGVGVILLAAGSALAQAPAPQTTLFENVTVFDGISEALARPSNVLVEGHVISRIAAEPIAVDPAERIAGGGGR